MYIVAELEDCKQISIYNKGGRLVSHSNRKAENNSNKAKGSNRKNTSFQCFLLSLSWESYTRALEREVKKALEVIGPP